MARYTGPVCRLCRREGEKLFLKGARCLSDKCPFERRSYAPGQHGQGRMRRASEYGIHLREKQKLRRIYGVLERQFERYYENAARARGVTGENLLIMLEARLDNIVYRLGWAPSRPAARQLVRHGHVMVNGRKVSIPSYSVKAGDEIAIREKSRNLPGLRANAEAASTLVPQWLEMNAETLTGRVIALPRRDQIDVNIQEHLIVEHYSR